MKPNPGRIITFFLDFMQIRFDSCLNMLESFLQRNNGLSSGVVQNWAGHDQPSWVIARAFARTGLLAAKFGVKHHRKQGVCVTALLSPLD